MSREVIGSYGFEPVATFEIVDNRFIVEITDQVAAAQTTSLYAFLLDGEILRFGSSKAVLSSRMKSWQRDVSAGLQGRKSSTSFAEAAQWKAKLQQRKGVVYSRRGTEVATSIGTFNAYMAEESFLIGLHRPPMNRSMHR